MVHHPAAVEVGNGILHLTGLAPLKDTRASLMKYQLLTSLWWCIQGPISWSFPAGVPSDGCDQRKQTCWGITLWLDAFVLSNRGVLYTNGPPWGQEDTSLTVMPHSLLHGCTTVSDGSVRKRWPVRNMREHRDWERRSAACWLVMELWGKPAWSSVISLMDTTASTGRQRLMYSLVSFSLSFLN